MSAPVDTVIAHVAAVAVQLADDHGRPAYEAHTPAALQAAATVLLVVELRRLAKAVEVLGELTEMRRDR